MTSRLFGYCVLALASIVGVLWIAARVDTGCRYDARKARLAVVSGGIEAYAIDLGHLPDALSELEASTDSQWKGPYARSDYLVDPQGAPIAYTITDPERCRYRLVMRARVAESGRRIPAVSLSSIALLPRCDANAGPMDDE